MNSLDDRNLQLIEDYEQSLQTNFSIFIEVHPQLAIAYSLTKAKLKVRLRSIIHQMRNGFRKYYSSAQWSRKTTI